MSVERSSSLRRVVTRNDDGHSSIALDGPPSDFIEFAPGVGLYEIWTDSGGPLNRRDLPNAVLGAVSLSPPPAGIKLRWFTVGPAADASGADDQRAFFKQAFASIGAHADQPDTTRHPGMHLTRTLDFIIVISGTVRLLLDDDERLLGPGDVVVQRGTNHAWISEGPEPALLVAVLIDKAFV